MDCAAVLEMLPFLVEAWGIMESINWDRFDDWANYHGPECAEASQHFIEWYLEDGHT